MHLSSSIGEHCITVAVDEDIAAVVCQLLSVMLPSDGTVVQVTDGQGAVNEKTLTGVPHHLSGGHARTITAS